MGYQPGYWIANHPLRAPLPLANLGAAPVGISCHSPTEQSSSNLDVTREILTRP